MSDKGKKFLKKSIIVVGAGASGLVAAIEAAKRGIDVTLLEADSQAGRKIYATGTGRCNLTNKKMSEEYFRSRNMAFVKEIIGSFGYRETISYFGELGLCFKDRDGYIYPRSGQASSVAVALYNECLFYGVHIILNSPVEAIEKKENFFYVKTPHKEYSSKGIILSCGSLAGIPKRKRLRINGYDLAKSLGHGMIPIVSSLTGMKCENKDFYKAVSGVRCDGQIRLLVEGGEGYETAAWDEGELQLTDYGVSGIPAFQVSAYGAYAIREKKGVRLKIDFVSNMTTDSIFNMIKEKGKKNKNITILQCFIGVINDKLAAALIEELHIPADEKACHIDDSLIKRLAAEIKSYTDNVTDVNDFASAQVLAGGINLDELKSTMESKLVPDLYMTGEMLDADGMCGGYNLQWAWATGYIAGNHILRE